MKPWGKNADVFGHCKQVSAVHQQKGENAEVAFQKVLSLNAHYHNEANVPIMQKHWPLSASVQSCSPRV